MSQLNGDVVEACANLVGRAGASSFEIGYMHDNVPVEEAGWYAVAFYQGARIQTDEHRSPTLAAMALAERLLRGATCRCGEPVTLADEAPGCRWSLRGKRWEPGCNAPTVTVKGATVGDHAAAEAALLGRMNRAQRRAYERRNRR